MSVIVRNSCGSQSILFHHLFLFRSRTAGEHMIHWGALGTCVLSSFGPGVVLNYRQEDDMHEAIIFFRGPGGGGVGQETWA